MDKLSFTETRMNSTEPHSMPHDTCHLVMQHVICILYTIAFFFIWEDEKKYRMPFVSITNMSKRNLVRFSQIRGNCFESHFFYFMKSLDLKV